LLIEGLRKFIKKLLDQAFIFISFCRAYIAVPKLLFQELCSIARLIYWRRRDTEAPEVLLSELRTKAHILDKSLQADNWEAGRCRIQYEALCKYIDLLEDSTLKMDSSYKWALAKKTEFEEAQNFGRGDHRAFKNIQTTITKADFLNLIQSRRSIRAFENRPIDPEILKELADVLSWAPTSCNRQPAKLFMTQNSDKIAKCMNQCAGATCFGEVIPCFIAVCADSRFYMIKDRILPFIDVSLGLQNMLLLAHLQGIEGTTLNWMHRTLQEDRVLRETLKIPAYYLIIINFVLGYPKHSVPTPGRKCNKLAYTLVG
jgi:nitroreductase